MRAFAAVSLLVLCAAPAAAQQVTALGAEVRITEVRRLEVRPAPPAGIPTSAASRVNSQAHARNNAHARSVTSRPAVLHVTANVDWQLEAASAAPTAVRVHGNAAAVRISREWTPLTRGEAGRTTVFVHPVDAVAEVDYRLVDVPAN